MRRCHWPLAVVLTLALIPIAPLRAYDDDTHYFFTYYLSRLVGYTPLQAFRIASADIGIDYAAETYPEQYYRTFRARHEIVDDRRVRFHAFRDSRVFNDLAVDNEFQAVKDAIDRMGASLRNDAERLNNPGVYLHFLQDTGPHDPYIYGSELGHLLHNHWPDFLSANETKAERMARDTVQALTAFMRECCPRQQARAVYYDRDIRPVIARLVEVNPAPPLPGGHLGRVVASKVKAADEIPGQNVNSQAASVVVKEALRALGNADAMPPLASRTPFEFNANGHLLEKDLDAIGLTGDLTLVISDPDGKPISSVVGRLRIGPAVIGAGGPLAGAGVSSANGAMTFERLPVGEVEVELAHPQYREQIVPVTLDRRERFVEVTLRPAPRHEPDSAATARTMLRVRVIDADTSRDIDAEIHVAGTSLGGTAASYAPAASAVTEVAPGVYEISATTTAGERASVWADVPAGRATEVELRVGDDRARNLAAGIAALRREIEALLRHPAVARRGDLETMRPMGRTIATTLGADRAEAGALADELTGVVLPACQLLSRVRTLQPADVATAERNADRVESLMAEARKESTSCADQASLDRARRSYGEAVRLVADTQRLANRTSDDPDRIRDAVRIVESAKPLVDRAATIALRLRSNLSQAETLRSLVAPALAYNDEVETRLPALARRVNELRALAAGDTARVAELTELGALVGRVQKLPVGSLEAAFREAELATGLAATLERPVTQLQKCPTAGAEEVAALADRLQTANMLSQLTLLSEGAGTERGLDACRSKLATSSPTSRSGSPGASPTERRLEDVVVSSSEITISVWDTACEDGDRITVRVNGAPVFLNHELRNQKVSRTIALASDINSIEVAANSTGHDCSPTTPPDKRVNTGAVSISGAARGGDQQWTLRDRNSSISRLIVAPNASPAGGNSATPPAGLGLGASSPIGAAAPGLGVGAVNGDVRMVAAGGRGGALTPGSSIVSGATLRTGPGARVDLQTTDGSAITLGATTRARIGPSASGGHDVTLALGSVDVTHPAGAAPVRVVTADGVIETIHTRYRVEGTPDGTIVEVLEGTLRLTGPAILRLALPGQQLGKPSPATVMELHAPGRAILLRATADAPLPGPSPSASARPAPIAVPAVPAVPANVVSVLPLPAGGRGSAQGASGRPSYLPSGTASRAALSLPDPWNDAQIQSLIDEWLRSAVPTGARPGQVWRYSDWAVILAPGAVAAGPPEHPADWTRHQTVWSVRTRLESQNLCTLGEFIDRRLTGQSLAGCS